MKNNASEAIKNGAIPTDPQYDNTEIQYGACRFCGQMFQIETAGGILSEKTLDEAATMKCGCADAVEFQDRARMPEKGRNAVRELFADEEATADVLNDCLPMIISGDIEAVVVTAPTGCQAKIKMTTKGKLKIERSEKTRRSREL